MPLFIMRCLLRTIFICSLLGFLFCGCGGQEEGTRSDGIKAPDFELEDLDGRIHRLSDLRGDVVMLNFFATWCGPCRQEVPDLVRLHQRFGKEGLRVIGASLDEDGDRALRPFIRQYSISYPILLATRKTLIDYGGVQGIPTTFLIDHEGLIRDQFVGVAPGYQLESSIRSLLKRRG